MKSETNFPWEREKINFKDERNSANTDNFQFDYSVLYRVPYLLSKFAVARTFFEKIIKKQCKEV